MTKNTSLWVLAVVCALANIFTACRKKQEPLPFNPPGGPSPATVVYDDYMMMRPGSYWIYEFYMLDSANGDAHPTGRYDSAYVAGDTIINFSRYRVYRYQDYFSTGYITRYQRDSLQYTVDHKGRILFATNDFVNVFRTYQFGPNGAVGDTIIVTEQMGGKNEMTTVPAGTFKTYSFLEVYHQPPGYPYGAERIKEHRYARNIGLVTESSQFYFALPQLHEKRLVRYHLADR